MYLYRASLRYTYSRIVYNTLCIHNKYDFKFSEIYIIYHRGTLGTIKLYDLKGVSIISREKKFNLIIIP